jgi:hypothetical protein
MPFIIREGAHACVITRYPRNLVHRAGPRCVEIAGVAHQRAEYFQRGR